MTSANRETIITEAIYRAGRKGQNLSLTNVFDAITRDISSRYPLLAHTENSQNMANAVGYVTLPANFAFREFMVANGVKLEWEEPEEFFAYIKVTTANTANPTHYTIDRQGSKIYLRPTPNSNAATNFFYACIHANSSNNAYVHTLGEEFDETITLGITAKACQLIQEYDRAAYWWHGGNPAEPLPGSYLYDLRMKAETRLQRTPGKTVLSTDYGKKVK